MLTPKQLHEEYSTNPCEPAKFTTDPLVGDKAYGRGTPYYATRVMQFLKHVKYPCYNGSQISGTGRNKLGLPYKFLQNLDTEAFTEIQSTIKSGTAHSVRNAADIARACKFYADNTKHYWHHRGATEYIEYFGSNSLPDCLMTLGPDLVSAVNSSHYTGRAPGVGDMYCFPHDGWGTVSTKRSCVQPPNPLASLQCRACLECPDPPSEKNFCCLAAGMTPTHIHLCCKAVLTTKLDFSYNIPPTEAGSINIRPRNSYFLRQPSTTFFTADCANRYFVECPDDSYGGTVEMLYRSTTINKLRVNDMIYFSDNRAFLYRGPSTDDQSAYVEYTYYMRHIGLLERMLYGGFANFQHHTGPQMHSAPESVFLPYFQSINGWNYARYPARPEEDTLNTNIIPGLNGIFRARTISTILSTNIFLGGQTPITNTQSMVDAVKDLLWNGYGVLLFSNVGFPETRDSQGVAYPDRIWYTTYAIIGYDDTKTEFNECVYLLSLPWGDWISGGHPSWGPLPPGCFLVTETHLKCMIKFYSDTEYYGCREECGNHGPADKCEQYYCSKQQAAFGMLYAISLNDGFPRQYIDHSQFWPVMTTREKFSETTLYYKYA